MSNMVELLTTNKTSFYIKKIIKEAKEYIGIVTFSTKLDEALLQLISDAHGRGVKITLIHGGKTPQFYLRHLLSKLINLSLLYNPKLHAKLYFNEKLMVVTSMNFSELLEHNNIELGVLLKNDEDSNAFKEAVKQARVIMQSSMKYTLKGYCVLCRKGIPYNMAKPYCLGCYRKLSESDKAFHLARYCHECGNELTNIVLEDFWMICESCVMNG